jgi:hypothetical protein
MDPNACLQRMFDALKAGEYSEANEAVEDYQEWLAKGGEPGAYVFALDDLRFIANAMSALAVKG